MTLRLQLVSFNQNSKLVLLWSRSIHWSFEPDHANPSWLHHSNIQSLEFCHTSDTVAMAEVQDLDVSARRGLRSVVRASITKLTTRVSELERKPELSHSDQLTAKRMQDRLAGLDSEFKSYHLSIVTLLEEETDLEMEQATINDHDDKVSGLFDRLMMLTTPVEREAKANSQQHLIKRLQHLELNLCKVSAEVSTAADNPEVDRCLLKQYNQ